MCENTLLWLHFGVHRKLWRTLSDAKLKIPNTYCVHYTMIEEKLISDETFEGKILWKFIVLIVIHLHCLRWYSNHPHSAFRARRGVYTRSKCNVVWRTISLCKQKGIIFLSNLLAYDTSRYIGESQKWISIGDCARFPFCNETHFSSLAFASIAAKWMKWISRRFTLATHSPSV